MEIKLEKQSDNLYDVWFNVKYLGRFVKEVDGFFHYWEDKSLNGSWSAYQLKAISDKLDEINKPYREVVEEYFDQERRNREERSRVEYRKLINETGMFFEFYPNLTGDWEKDKLEWFVIHADLEDLRAQNGSF